MMDSTDSCQTFPSVYTCYSKLQNDIIGYLSLAPAVLSFICSAFIMRHVIMKSRTGPTTTYHRLVGGLSFWDIVSSSANFISVFTLNTNLNYYEMAESPSCPRVGFSLVMSTGHGCMYNMMLSIFFLLVVRFQVRDDTIRKYIEPWMHLFPLLIIGGICVAGLVFQLYYPLTRARYCWLTEFHCDEGDEACLADKTSSFGYVLQIVVTGLFFFCFIVIVSTNASIFLFVRSSERRNGRFLRAFMKMPNNAAKTTKGSDDISHKKDNKTRRVAQQSLLFCGGYLATYFFAVLQLLLENYVGTNWYYALRVVTVILWPLQGFFDFLIYFRPRYLEWRKMFPTSRWDTIRVAVLTVESSRAYRHRRRSQVANIPRRDDGEAGELSLQVARGGQSGERTSMTLAASVANFDAVSAEVKPRMKMEIAVSAEFDAMDSSSSDGEDITVNQGECVVPDEKDSPDQNVSSSANDLDLDV